MLLEVKNLCFNHYKKPLCLKDINFSAAKGEKVLLLASHEMGKTTFLSVISGFDRSYFGSIMLCGREVKKLKDEEKNVSFLPIAPVALGGKTLLQNLNFAASVSGKNLMTDADAEKLCSEYGLTYNKKQKFKKLTLAEKRLFAIARASIKNADIIFVDDQFEGLTKEEQDKLLKVYEKLLNNNQTAIFALSDESYKFHKNWLKSAKFDKILYLCDAKMRIFNSLAEFEKEILTIDMLNFFDEKLNNINCVIERQEGFYNIYFGDKFFSLDKKFNSKLDKLNLEIEDSEYAILFTKEKFDAQAFSEEDFNKLLGLANTLLFSNLSGERLI